MSDRSKVYGVYDGFDRVKLESVAVEKITGKKVFLAARELVFGCAKTIELADACFTPEDAIARYVAKQMDEIDRANRRAEEARQRIDAARALAPATAKENGK